MATVASTGLPSLTFRVVVGLTTPDIRPVLQPIRTTPDARSRPRDAQPGRGWRWPSPGLGSRRPSSRSSGCQSGSSHRARVPAGALEELRRAPAGPSTDTRLLPCAVVAAVAAAPGRPTACAWVQFGNSLSITVLRTAIDIKLSRLRNSWGWRLGAVLNSPGKHPFALDRRLDAGSGGPAARREVEVGLFRRVADRASEHRWVTDAGRAPRGVAGGALVMSPGVRAGRR